MSGKIPVTETANGAPFRIKLRIHTALKSLYKIMPIAFDRPIHRVTLVAMIPSPTIGRAMPIVKSVGYLARRAYRTGSLLSPGAAMRKLRGGRTVLCRALSANPREIRR